MFFPILFCAIILLKSMKRLFFFKKINNRLYLLRNNTIFYCYFIKAVDDKYDLCFFIIYHFFKPLIFLINYESWEWKYDFPLYFF